MLLTGFDSKYLNTLYVDKTFAPLLSEPPCFETAWAYGEVFELVWMLAGDQAVSLYVPTLTGVLDALLDYCTRYATPVASGSEA